MLRLYGRQRVFVRRGAIVMGFLRAFFRVNGAPLWLGALFASFSVTGCGAEPQLAAVAQPAIKADLGVVGRAVGGEAARFGWGTPVTRAGPMAL